MSESSNPKKLSDHIPPLKDQGMDYLVAAAAPGVGVQFKKITQSGVAPLIVVLEDEGLINMADTDYVVIVQGETTARVTVDESTVTKTGFNVLGGADTEVIHLMIVGRLKGQAA